MSPIPVIPGVEILEPLGGGSQGLVLRARRGELDCAVKIPWPEQEGTPRAAAHLRFVREAVALARVTHPAIPAVLEVGHAGGVPYLLMEFVRGEPLSLTLTRGSIGAARTLALGATLARALEAIHGAGLVHRDVKPDNILMDPETGTARLVDLGLSVDAGMRCASSGTPAYAAPEQLGATGAPVDGRADLFSVGVVLAECLAGHRLAPDEQLPDTAGSELAAIVERLLEVSPHKRYSSAAALAVAIERCTRTPDAQGVRAIKPEPTSSQDIPLARREKLRLLVGASLRAAEAGGAAARVVGVAGSGKSWLLDRTEERLTREGRVVLRATGTPQAQPFSAVRTLLDQAVLASARHSPPEAARTPDVLREAIGDLAPLVTLLSREATKQLGLDALKHPPPADRSHEMVLDGLAELVIRLLVATAPALVAIDDLQWVDDGSQGVLARVATRIDATKTLLVLSGREEGGAFARVLGTPARSPEPDLTLELLTMPEAADLVRGHLGRIPIDATTLDRLAGLTDRTPLGTLEGLRAVLDAGLLLPRSGAWQLDGEGLARLALPKEAAGLVRHRLDDLSAEIIGVLTCAAVIGQQFDTALLSAASGVGAPLVEAALEESRRAFLVEPIGLGQHRFVHAVVRETLLEHLDPAAARDAHQRVADAMDHAEAQPAVAVPIDVIGLAVATSEPASDEEARRVYALAHHRERGQPATSPARAVNALVAAARIAFARFDGGQIIAFLEGAEHVAAETGAALPLGMGFLKGEALLRIGFLGRAFTEFEQYLEGTTDPIARANALGRIAWIHEARLDSQRAWTALGLALALAGDPLPSNDARALIAAAGSWTRRTATRQRLAPTNRRHMELLCVLHSQAARLAIHTGRVTQLIRATVRSLEIALHLGPSPALARAQLTYGFVMIVLGQRSRGESYLSSARSIAIEARNPVAIAHVLQGESAVLAWAGDWPAAVEAGSHCIVEMGHWRELSEYCLTCFNLYAMEATRGRDREAWSWLERAIARVRAHEGEPVVGDFLEAAAGAALAALGKEAEAPLRLARLREVCIEAPADSALRDWTLLGRVAALAADGRLGAKFESAVAEFKRKGHDPRKVHLGVATLYVHVAHARVHACLRAPMSERAVRLAAVRSALDDLQATARVPVLRAHALAIEGWYEWLAGRDAKAEEAFGRAEALGAAEGAPWVLHAVHRGRAHLFRARGREPVALDAARVAESIAREHGSVHRARVMREEMGLSLHAPGPTASDRPRTSHRSRQTLATRSAGPLRALVRMVRKRPETLGTGALGAAIVDELIEALAAECGELFLVPPEQWERPSAEEPRLTSAARRDRRGRILEATPEGLARAEAWFAHERAQGPEGAERTAEALVLGERAILWAPLRFGGAVVGVQVLERSLADGGFDDDDANELGALVEHVPATLEVARAFLLGQRGKEASREAEKLDAMARLAGAIAHDFANIVMAVDFSALAIVQDTTVSAVIREDAAVIRGAAQQAQQLARQLAQFSRGQLQKTDACDVNDVVADARPLLAKVAGVNVTLSVALDARPAVAWGNPGQINQVLMNLVSNARDAMPGGGRIEISTRNEILGEDAALERPEAAPGPYVVLEVKDTGHGMTEATRRRVFEPYFTTKAEGQGSGLGLATVYGIVRRCRGHIALESRPGEGSRFTIRLPAAEGAAATGRAGAVARSAVLDG